MKVLNKENIKEVKWHKRTQIVWDRVDSSIIEGLTPDYVSGSGSSYYYLEEGIVRMSNHWGHSISNCSWYLRDDGERYIDCFVDKRTSKDTCGFVKYTRIYNNIASYDRKKRVAKAIENDNLRNIERAIKWRKIKKDIYSLLCGEEVKGISIAKINKKTLSVVTPSGLKRIECHKCVTIEFTLSKICNILGVCTPYFCLNEVKRIKGIVGQC